MTIKSLEEKLKGLDFKNKEAINQLLKNRYEEGYIYSESSIQPSNIVGYNNEVSHANDLSAVQALHKDI